MTDWQAAPIVLSSDELSLIPRELRFNSVSNSSPKKLTQQQLAFFNETGYVKGIRIFSDSEITKIRAFFNKILAETLATGQDSYSIKTAHLKYGEVYDLLTNARIVDYVKDLLGENVVAWGSHFFCKLPHDGKAVTWHQDAVYWPLTPSKTVTVWLAIDDAAPENANMRFIPGSHLHGALPHQPSTENEDNVLDHTAVNPLSFGQPVDDSLQAGEISIHSDLLLHGSEANQSDHRRCGLTLRFCATEVRAHLGWHEKGIVVSGVDLDRHWANPSRPNS
jgi:non-haem Fe2+, alpha-ketoglutarate-dependent halogenase